MAPEVLSSETYPKSDVWSAGVLCYQLLTGYLPFDDPKNPKNPALSKIWKAILTEDPPFRGSAWKEISDQAKDFIRLLLQKCALLCGVSCTTTFPPGCCACSLPACR